MLAQKMNIAGFMRIPSRISAGCLLLLLTLPSEAAPLTAGEPIPLPGTQGGYDFIRVD